MKELRHNVTPMLTTELKKKSIIKVIINGKIAL